MRRVVRFVLLAWIGLAGLGIEARAQGTVSAPGGVAAGGEIRESTINIGIPPEQVAVITEALKREQRLTDEQRQTIAKLEGNLGVSGGALRAFFRTLGEAEVPPERQERKLVEIAEHYKQLVTQVAAAPGDDPEVAKLKGEAKAALDAGQLERANDLLAQVQAAQLPLIHNIAYHVLIKNPRYFDRSQNLQSYEFKMYSSEMADLAKTYVSQVEDAIQVAINGGEIRLEPASHTLLDISRRAELLVERHMHPFSPADHFMLLIGLSDIGFFHANKRERLNALDHAMNVCEMLGESFRGNWARSAIVSLLAGCQAEVLLAKGINMLAAGEVDQAVATFRAASDKARKHEDDPLLLARSLQLLASAQSQRNCSDARKTLQEAVAIYSRNGQQDVAESLKEKGQEWCS
jgi:hypothetical protein